ncbi:TetR/AcrR family transcriptional regulator [Streptomyces sp. UNOC14_S4]|uniref:TetR/AcrR family transcriptional regulator n=1 Tax=Streptomyces sp. UNOC14_S4 TaxID=2872340 RepID=UPI001E4446DA|nr:TetR/AcrR family transcriptional regulator [Streptomyces sp. UNOC14_S4]MCC3768464.1 TetR/AcrR family transcriptional regulator [Streptomyces sp. UNOC14_S4]
MGHREDLLEGAKACLLEKGWVRTTARDIVAASGANLASIGYHYGSKDALMMAAFMKMTEEWGDEMGRAMVARVPVGTSREELLAARWDTLIAGFEESRKFWEVQLEVVGQLGANPELKKWLAGVFPEGREGMVAVFEGVEDGEVSEEVRRTAGVFYHTLFIGLWVQWIIDPGCAPTGAELVEGMRRALAGEVFGPSAAGGGAVARPHGTA